MINSQFSLPMKKSEKIAGWMYLPIHIFAFSFVLSFVYYFLLNNYNIALDNAQLNLIYYAAGFSFVILFLFRFFKASFSDLCDNFGKTITSLILGYVLYYAMNYLLSSIMMLFTEELNNPNSETVISELKLNINVMTAVAVILAPIVEEALFRGVVFGTIRKKNRVAAYLISIALFSIYHLWSYYVDEFDWTMIIYMLEYVPASIILAWCYERSKNIWAPIFLHSFINLVSLSVQISI